MTSNGKDDMTRLDNHNLQLQNDEVENEWQLLTTFDVEKTLQKQLDLKEAEVKMFEELVFIKDENSKAYEIQLQSKDHRIIRLEIQLQAETDKINTLKNELECKLESFKAMESELTNKCEQNKALENEIKIGQDLIKSLELSKDKVIYWLRYELKMAINLNEMLNNSLKEKDKEIRTKMEEIQTLGNQAMIAKMKENEVLKRALQTKDTNIKTLVENNKTLGNQLGGKNEEIKELKMSLQAKDEEVKAHLDYIQTLQNRLRTVVKGRESDNFQRQNRTKAKDGDIKKLGNELEGKNKVTEN